MLYNAFVLKEKEDKTLEGVFCSITLYDNMSLDNLKEKLNFALNHHSYIAKTKYKDFNQFKEEDSNLADYTYLLDSNNIWYYMDNNARELKLKLLTDEWL